MYKGHWYDVLGKERSDLRPMTLNFDTLQLAVDEVMHVFPDTKLIRINLRLSWALVSIESTKRMLICLELIEK